MTHMERMGREHEKCKMAFLFMMLWLFVPFVIGMVMLMAKKHMMMKEGTTCCR